jgi:GNAT superfamily N-acetyltransferase
MSSTDGELSNLKFYPLTSKRWKDLERLFGPRGACEGCWCMWWRIPRAEFMKNRGQRNKEALKNIVDSGKVPGILAYLQSKPVGWCAVAPRDDYQPLERSRLLKRVDEKPLWSVVCFFVAKEFRHKGITVKLLNAAVDYARKEGGKIVEGYPKEAKKTETRDTFFYTGPVSTFRKAGFVEIARRSESRPIMRYLLERTE